MDGSVASLAEPSLNAKSLNGLDFDYGYSPLRVTIVGYFLGKKLFGS